MGGCPDLDVRAAQVWLTYLGYDTGGIDGIERPARRSSATSHRSSYES